MERSLIIEEDVKMEELQLSEDECQKENQLEQLQPQEIEEQQAMLQPHSHDHNHHHSQEEEQQQQQQYQCDPKRLDVLSSENKIVIPTSSSSLELIEVAPAVSPQPTLNPQAALPSTIHPLSLHKDTQLSISPSLSLNSEGGEQENTHQQQHTPSTAPQQRKQLENNEEGTGSGAAKKLDQEYSVSDNAVETTEPPLNQVTMSTCLNNSVNSETAMNLSNSISISADVSDSNTNIAVAEDLIGPEPISIDRPNELTSLAEEADAAMTTRSPDDINGDQSLPVPLESQSPVSMVTATSPSVVVDQHSSEEELECINQENSHPEKRKWSQSNNNSCCFTDSAGSSDEEVKEFMLDPKPILFSSAPPSGIQKVMRSSSANFLVPNGPPLSICAISPRKRHRLNSSSDSLDLENISVIQRPCLDFEKMQKTLMRKHTSHSVSRAKIVKIKTISGNGTSSKCWFDPAVCSFRSISTAYSPLPPVEEPSCAY
ncbi:homeobox protein 13 [Octopus sinensis]|uniref:Homeobox protein 13 n=1 Tax=Octopus sinensis TaxID=2607531 RepID=A0A6P7S7Y4_9MOLL|nr:homeobox protein 13 [Octopus sinensis]